MSLSNAASRTIAKSFPIYIPTLSFESTSTSFAMCPFLSPSRSHPNKTIKLQIRAPLNRARVPSKEINNLLLAMRENCDTTSAKSQSRDIGYNRASPCAQSKPTLKSVNSAVTVVVGIDYWESTIPYPFCIPRPLGTKWSRTLYPFAFSFFFLFFSFGLFAPCADWLFMNVTRSHVFISAGEREKGMKVTPLTATALRINASIPRGRALRAMGNDRDGIPDNCNPRTYP